MFDLDLTKPIILQQHEALLERLSPDHPKWAEIDRKKGALNAGYNGEKTLNYFLGLLPAKNYHIFHGLRLPIGKSFFQIDAYLLSPKLSFTIESKYYADNLLIEKHQLTQTTKDTKNIYQNPLTQVNRHKILLKYLFEKHQIPFPPIEHLACFTHSSSIINISPGYIEAEKRVCKAAALIKIIDGYEKFYKKDIIDQKTILKIKRLLLSKHAPNRTDILKTYDISKQEIEPGVQCPICKHSPMLYQRGRWGCTNCGCISADAHLKAIQDFFLIHKTFITNAELREFLQLSSPRTATYLMSHLDLPFTGTTKGRVYHSPQK